MSEQKKSDSQLENAEKTAPNGEKSANAVENPDKDARELSKDELEAVSGGNIDISRNNAVLTCSI